MVDITENMYFRDDSAMRWASSEDVSACCFKCIGHVMGMILDMLHAVLLFKYREDRVWSDLHRIDASLYQKKPPKMLLRLWRDRMTRARGDRLAMTGGLDLDGGCEHLWIRRIIKSIEDEPWHAEFQKQMAQDELRGVHIADEDQLWQLLEFYETYQTPSRQTVSAVDTRPPKPGQPGPWRAGSRRNFLANLYRTKGADKAKGGRGGAKRPNRGAGGRGQAYGGAQRKALPGDGFWMRLGYESDYPNARPNDPEWTCYHCGMNPCKGYCFTCLRVCVGHHTRSATQPSARLDSAAPPGHALASMCRQRRASE